MPPALWYVDSTNTLHRVRVKAGLSDGQRTEVTADGIHEGMQVIVGVNADQASGGSAPASAQAQGSTNPFQPARPGGGFRRGM